MHVRQQDRYRVTLAEYVDRLQQSGRYTFTRQDVIRDLPLSPVAIKRAAERLVAQGRLVAPRRGFFVVVPLEYKSAGAPPPSWFIDALMRFHASPYYVSLLSAASLYGAAAQQPQELQVMTNRQLRPVVVGRGRIRFLLKKNLERTPKATIKTETGSMQVATPEANAVDLVRYAEHAGGWSNVAEVLADLAEKIDPDRLAEEKERGMTIDLGFAHAEIVWCQEEPKNMGAWRFVESRLRELLGPDIAAAADDQRATVQPQDSRVAPTRRRAVHVSADLAASDSLVGVLTHSGLGLRDGHKVVGAILEHKEDGAAFPGIGHPMWTADGDGERIPGRELDGLLGIAQEASSHERHDLFAG